MEIKEKAWIINANDFEEHWYAPQDFIYAESEGQAKTKALRIVCDGDYARADKEDWTFTNIKIRRSKEGDKYLFEGNLVPKHIIDATMQERKRIAELEEMLANPLITHCYIRKRGTYYRPNSSGYTDRRCWAGVYTIEEGVDHAKGCDELSLEIIDVKEHNEMIVREIESLKTRLILDLETIS